MERFSNIFKTSSTQNPDIWRALKAGSNNCGIVTRFTARIFSSTKIWSGFLYLPNSQMSKVISTFHYVVNRVDWDHHAAGPLACFAYIQPLGLEAISVKPSIHEVLREEVARILE